VVKTGVFLKETGYKVVAIMFFGEREVGRFPTLEQAEWRAKEMNEWSERNPRGYIQYLVRPIDQPPRDE
jgi:hypothetical protein